MGAIPLATTCASTQCEFYKQYKERLQCLSKLAICIENLVYQKYSGASGLHRRISFYQVVGSFIKLNSESISEANPMKNFLHILGRSKKLMGQIENEISAFLNYLVLEPIEKCRMRDMSEVQPIQDAIERLKNVHPEQLEDLHQQLHRVVRFQNKIFENLGTRIYPILEFQAQYYQYNCAYIDGLLDFLKHKATVKEYRKYDLEYYIGLYKKSSEPLVDYRQEIIDLEKAEEVDADQEDNNKPNENIPNAPIADQYDGAKPL